MEIRDGIILPHDPGGGQAQFVLARSGDGDDLGIKATHGIASGSIAREDAVRNLRKCVLHFPGMCAVGEGFFQLRVVEGLAEPGCLPKEKWHEHEQKRQRQNDKEPTALEAGFGGSRNDVIAQKMCRLRASC